MSKSAPASSETSSYSKISSEELYSGAWLALVFGLRMLGLFLVLPVFSVYTKTLPGGENIMWAGIAMGAFSLTQGFLQIPLGFASDKWGRKRIIVVGLLVYAVGSLMAAWAPTIHWLILARCIQGMGAISAAISALAADLTREQHRAKVMAMIGASIGVVFSFSLVGAPALYAWIGMQGIFKLIAVLALLAIVVVLGIVPDPEPITRHPEPEKTSSFAAVFADSQLLRLNFGVFSKHMIQMALFLVVPRLLVERYKMPLGHHWMLYLPVVLGSFVLAVPGIIFAEKRKQFKLVFLCAISLIFLSQLGLMLGSNHFFILAGMLFLFFVAFNILEASMPALVSRIAPPHIKGLALGAYNTCQAFGAGLGAAAGGTLALKVGPMGVFVAGMGLCLIWGIWMITMKIPAFPEKREFDIPTGMDLELLKKELFKMKGVSEVSIQPELNKVYLKIRPDQVNKVALDALFNPSPDTLLPS